MKALQLIEFKLGNKSKIYEIIIPYPGKLFPKTYEAEQSLLSKFKGEIITSIRKKMNVTEKTDVTITSYKVRIKASSIQ
jgi:hypothetical protein